VKLQLALLRTAAFLVPRSERKEWLAEWRSELWYVRKTRHGEATAFCLGAFPDALWIRRNSPPLRCILTLAVLAGVSFLSTFHMMRTVRILPHLLVVFMALLVLPAVTSLTWAGRRWMFFATKIVFLVTIVFCGALAVMSVAAPILGPILLAGYVGAFRWALIDQRQRCPVCLRVLSNPVRIGQSSETFLSWYGTELICAMGHGVLHVPEIATSCYRAQRWLSLEPHAGA
jgi:hypothetical protein